MLGAGSRASRHSSGYAKRIGAGVALVNEAVEYKIRAERRLGEILAENPTNKGGRPTEKTGTSRVPVNGPPTLDDLGITKKVSACAQQLASIPAPILEKRLAERRLGEILKENPKAIGTRGKIRGKDSSGAALVVGPEESVPTRAELGLTYKESARAKQLAAILACPGRESHGHPVFWVWYPGRMGGRPGIPVRASHALMI